MTKESITITETKKW